MISVKKALSDAHEIYSMADEIVNNYHLLDNNIRLLERDGEGPTEWQKAQFTVYEYFVTRYQLAE